MGGHAVIMSLYSSHYLSADLRSGGCLWWGDRDLRTGIHGQSGQYMNIQGLSSRGDQELEPPNKNITPVLSTSDSRVGNTSGREYDFPPKYHRRQY